MLRPLLNLKLRLKLKSMMIQMVLMRMAKMKTILVKVLEEMTNLAK